MSDDASTDAEREPEGPRPQDPSEASHDDIMKRLIDYQRRQQGGATKEEAASSVWAVPASAPPTSEAAPAPPAPTEVQLAPAEVHVVPPEVDQASSEVHPAQSEVHPAQSEVPPRESHPATDADARIERLQEAFDRLGSQIGEMRQAFQDMAIAADERLTEIESEIARVRAESEQGP